MINDKGLKSNDVLALLGPDLREMGFQVEASKKKVDKLQRPVFFGENGNPTLKYEIDAYHEGWRCGLEVKAGRGWMGNTVCSKVLPLIGSRKTVSSSRSQPRKTYSE